MSNLGTPTEDGLTTHWKLDETSGIVVHDSAGGYDGILIQAPIIDQTTTLRASAFKPGWKPSNSDTQTYIFISDVITQSSGGEKPGPDWPDPGTSVNGQRIDYGMDPDIVNDTGWGAQIKDSLKSLPTLSIVTDLDNLFDSTTGIYVNPDGRGEAWERPVSLELINPDGTEGFHINAGIRLRGGSSRRTSNAKHSLRFFFRDEYGDSKLRYALFDNEGADEYDHIDLRTSSDFSWENGSSRFVFLRDLFSRDSQRDVGQEYTRSRYYHTYINGQYWGVYQSMEKPKASYGETYIGGDKEDYDAIKIYRDSVVQETFTILVTDGNFDAYERLWDACVNPAKGFETIEEYMKIQGLNPDGTFNPDYECLVDVDNLIDFMLVIFYTGNRDEPVSTWLGNAKPNNVWTLGNRNGGDGFKYFTHDNENTLDDGEFDRTGPFPVRTEFRYFNPQVTHQALTANPEYLLRFADRTYRHFFNDGALMDAAALTRLQTRIDQLYEPIIGESARWGDSSRTTPYTRDNWLIAVDVVKAFFSNRAAAVLNQIRGDGFYPDVEVPALTAARVLGFVAADLQLASAHHAIHATHRRCQRQSARARLSSSMLRYFLTPRGGVDLARREVKSQSSRMTRASFGSRGSTDPVSPILATERHFRTGISRDLQNRSARPTTLRPLDRVAVQCPSSFRTTLAASPPSRRVRLSRRSRSREHRSRTPHPGG